MCSRAMRRRPDMKRDDTAAGGKGRPAGFAGFKGFKGKKAKKEKKDSHQH